MQKIDDLYDATHVGEFHQRNVVVTSTGVLVLFAFITYVVDEFSSYQSIQYKTSTDNGINWGSWIMVNDGVDNWIGDNLDVCIDGSDNIYIVFPAWGEDISFIKLTYNSGTWNIGAFTQAIPAGTKEFRYPSICVRSNGDIWIGAEKKSTSYFHTAYSTDGGDTWTQVTETNTSDTCGGIRIYPIGSDIHAIVSSGVNIKHYIYTSSWDSGTIIESNPLYPMSRVSVVKISDTEVWIAFVENPASWGG